MSYSLIMRLIVQQVRAECQHDCWLFCSHTVAQEARGSGTGPALTGMIDQERDSKVGCGLEAVSRWCTLVHPEENDVRKSVPRQPRAILRICYSSYVK
eukprot:scaffold95463_cov60-Phaeocystis_antarctica.AAC.1